MHRNKFYIVVWYKIKLSVQSRYIYILTVLLSATFKVICTKWTISHAAQYNDNHNNNNHKENHKV